MKRRYIVYLLSIVFMVILLCTNIKFRETIDFNSECIRFEIDSFDYDFVNVKIEGEVRKKIFEDNGDVYLRIELDDVTYPIRTDSLESIPIYSHMKLKSYDYENYIMIPLMNTYWNHITNEPFYKFHGVLYIDLENETVLIGLSDINNTTEGWSFEKGYQAIVSEKDILSALKIMEKSFKWNLQDWITIYENKIQN